jgi:large subunit ribosomal protein L12
MENIYAVLLLHKAGKEITEENLNKVLSAVDIEVDETKIKSLIASLKGVDINKELENASFVSSNVSASENISAKENKDSKTEEKKEEKAPAAEGLSALFG